MSVVRDLSEEREKEPDRIDCISHEPKVNVADESLGINEDEASIALDIIEEQVVTHKVQDILPFVPGSVQSSEAKPLNTTSSN